MIKWVFQNNKWLSPFIFHVFNLFRFLKEFFGKSFENLYFNLFVFFVSSCYLKKKKTACFFKIFSGHSICIAYLGFHTLLYFEHQDLLALENEFFYYNKGTQTNQIKVINGKNVFLFLPWKCATSNNIILVE